MDEAGRKELWDLYAKTKSSEIREKIIIEYAPFFTSEIFTTISISAAPSSKAFLTSSTFASVVLYPNGKPTTVQILICFP